MTHNSAETNKQTEEKHGMKAVIQFETACLHDQFHVYICHTASPWQWYTSQDDAAHPHRMGCPSEESEGVYQLLHALVPARTKHQLTLGLRNQVIFIMGLPIITLIDSNYANLLLVFQDPQWCWTQQHVAQLSVGSDNKASLAPCLPLALSWNRIVCLFPCTCYWLKSWVEQTAGALESSMRCYARSQLTCA